MTYNEAMEIINNTGRFSGEPGISIMKKVLARLDHPERDFKYIHVAGTNGKGSTCAFLESIFRAQGMKVGLFTSPHLVNFEERIQVNRELIPKSKITEYTAVLTDCASEIHMTYFDYCLSLALLYFRDMKVDIAIIETGLGGRLDSTNALECPLASVITRIGYDHMAILGDTLSKIAAEKAGIMKEGVPVFSSPQDLEAMEVLRNHASHNHTGGFFVTPQDTIDKMSLLNMKLPGVHQWENAALAYETAMYVLEGGRDAGLGHESEKCDFAGASQGCEERDFAEVEESMITAICNTEWAGRLQIISESPFFAIDGAHNSHGIRALKDSLTRLWPGEKYTFIMAVMADKDYGDMVKELLPLATEFYTVSIDNTRSLGAGELTELINDMGVPSREISGVDEIEGVLSKERKTIALGSLYFIGEILTNIFTREQI